MKLTVRNKPTLLATYIIVITSLFLSSCAQKPWGDALEEDDYDVGLAVVKQLTKESVRCQSAFSSDIHFEYSNALGKRRFAGFLQYSPGPNYKFVASNPLGQPVIIIAGNQKKYQMINTLETKYLAGGMTSFALRYRLPIHFLKGRWDDWLTGGNSISTDYVTSISRDKELRGIWVTVEDNKGAGNISHLLIDPEKRVIRERLLETRQKKPLAHIVYDDFLYQAGCQQPQGINISGLEYGTTIDIRLSQTERTSEMKKFSLKAPRGYLKQYRP